MAQTTTTAEAPRVEAQHFHRWRIDEPNGPTSTGVCKECGVAKQFKNWLSDMDFITNEEHRVAA
jgi:hypothetical protein